MSDLTHSDLAPWWIKEIRIYGISAIAACAFAWFGWQVYLNSRADTKEQAVVLKNLTEHGQAIIDKNTDAYYSVAKALDGNNQALWQLNKTIGDSNKK